MLWSWACAAAGGTAQAGSIRARASKLSISVHTIRPRTSNPSPIARSICQAGTALVSEPLTSLPC